MTVRAGFVLLAGGMGSRVGANVNKVFLQLAGQSIIDYSFATAARSELVTHIVIVIRPDEVAYIQHLIDRHRNVPDQPGKHQTDVRTAIGGETRHDSERAGINALRAEIDSDLIDVVAVHDGARPFLSRDLLERAVTAAAEVGSALPACPVPDSLYSFDQEQFVDSSQYVWSQTPQTFNAKSLLAAHDAARAAGHHGIDTAEVVQTFTQQTVHIVDGDPGNIKVTYQRDLAAAEDTASGLAR